MNAPVTTKLKNTRLVKKKKDEGKRLEKSKENSSGAKANRAKPHQEKKEPMEEDKKRVREANRQST